tara:strand:- start:2347 stop:3480 length:1134 start_codon:yes stop_codon:yes gene_type:complete
MRLGILCSSIGQSGGGVSTVISEHVHNMPPDIDSTLYSSKAEGVLEKIARSDANINLFYSPFKGRYSIYPTALKKINHDNLDIYHQHGIWNFNAICGQFAASFKKKPLVLSPHGMLDPWIIDRGRKTKSLMNLLFQKKNIKNSTFMHALTDKEASQFRNYGYSGNIVKIPNGVNKSAVRAQLLKGEKFRLLYLGRIDPKKNVIELATAVKRLLSEGLEISLDIYGWGDDLYIKKLTSLIDGVNGINFKGPVYDEAKVAAFLDADLFILPSQSEGLPMAVLEAWSYGVPCLLSHNCNLPEGFSYNAALPTEVNTAGIISALKDAYKMSSASLTNMGDCATQLAHEHFSWESVMSDFRNVYLAACGYDYSEKDLHRISL